MEAEVRVVKVFGLHVCAYCASGGQKSDLDPLSLGVRVMNECLVYSPGPGRAASALSHFSSSNLFNFFIILKNHILKLNKLKNIYIMYIHSSYSSGL